MKRRRMPLPQCWKRQRTRWRLVGSVNSCIEPRSVAWRLRSRPMRDAQVSLRRRVMMAGSPARREKASSLPWRFHGK